MNKFVNNVIKSIVWGLFGVGSLIICVYISYGIGYVVGEFSRGFMGISSELVGSVFVWTSLLMFAIIVLVFILVAIKEATKVAHTNKKLEDLSKMLDNND